MAIVIREKGKLVVKKLITIHDTPNKGRFQFEIAEESDGTKRILDFSTPFEYVINNSATVLIDEIDQSIHTHLLKKRNYLGGKRRTANGERKTSEMVKNNIIYSIFRYFIPVLMVIDLSPFAFYH